MNLLQKLGYNDWFISKEDKSKLELYQPARIITVNKTNYHVSTGGDEFLAELSGKFLFTADTPEDYPAAGDWVYIQSIQGEEFGIIHEIFPRRNILKRKTPGKKSDHQVIAANIDTAFIMQALETDYNIRRLERYLLMINESSIHPVLLLSKKDLLPESEINDKIKNILSIYPKLEIIPFSNNSETDIEVIRGLLQPHKTYCLLGSSGVGKSTLLNNLLNEEKFRTQAVKEWDGKGKHTTTRRELIILENGSIIIDTPGMKELGIVGADEGLKDTFSDVIEFLNRCKFTDCTHSVEEGCAVRAALESGELTTERYQSYKKIYKEVLFNEMSYFERRQKDKKFGKMVNSILKHKKDKR